jgi:hypothetical protein
MSNKIINLTNLTLIVALTLSTVAAYYSIIGLTAIFAGAVIPIIVMGSILEVGKIVTTVWLKKYWIRVGWFLRTYLVGAVILLALLTSMGIFGFLSKAHSDQGLVSGDSLAKLALIDEKIKTQRDNINISKKALEQMDAQVDQMLGRTDTDKGAERAVQIRKQQAKERTSLQNDIATAQKEIAKLNEERAPIAAENRKVEAEVGPIKYIAAFIYGDNPDANLLERAVRWVIILLVIVFDPLAIALVLAANSSKIWDLEEPEDDFDEIGNDAWVADVGEKPTEEEEKKSINDFVEQPQEYIPDEVYDIPPTTIEPEQDYGLCPKCNTKLIYATGIGPFCPNQECEVVDGPFVEESKAEEPKAEAPQIQIINSDEVVTEGVTVEHPIRELEGDYMIVDGRHMRRDAAKELRPDLFMLKPDDDNTVKSSFGTNFPSVANRGDIFVRVDVLPNRAYRFDGKRWFEVNKENNNSYLHDKEYVKHLVAMIESGQYDVELLSDTEKAEIEQYLSEQNN